MFKSPKRLASRSVNSIEKTPATLPHVPRRDRSMVFKETLLDAAMKNEFGFKERDIIPLFVKYQSKRQIIIDILSFLTYVVQLPTQFYLRRSRNSNFVPENRDRWFKTIGNINNGSSF